MFPSNPHYRVAVARAATPAIAVLVAANVDHEVLSYHHDPRNDAFGDEAVAALATATASSPKASLRGSWW